VCSTPPYSGASGCPYGYVANGIGGGTPWNTAGCQSGYVFVASFNACEPYPISWFCPSGYIIDPTTGIPPPAPASPDCCSSEAALWPR
jgi:hypothetical protein